MVTNSGCSVLSLFPSPLTGVSKLKQGKGEDVLSLLRHAYLRQT